MHSAAFARPAPRFLGVLTALGLCLALGAAVSAGYSTSAVAAAAVALLAVAVFRKPSVGALAVIVLYAALPRDSLFSRGVPVLSGALKITDILLIVTCAAWGARVAAGRSAPLAGSRPIMVIVLLLVMLGVIGVVTARGHATPLKLALNELRPLLGYLLLAPILGDVTKTRELKFGIAAFLTATASLSAITIEQYLSGHGSQATYAGGDLRVDGTPFALPVVALVWLAAIWPYARTPLARLAIAICAVLDVAGTLLTFRRGGWIGGLVAVVCVGLLLPRRQRRRLLATFAVLAVLAVSALPFAGTVSAGAGAWLHGVSQRFNSVSAGGEDLSARYRLTEWHFDIKSIEAHPVVGIGVGSGVSFADPRYTPGVGYGAVWSHPYIHNSYLWFAVKLGIGGLLALVAFLGVALRRAWVAYRATADDEVAGLLAGAMASLVCLIVMSFTDAHFNSVNITASVAGIVAVVEVVRKMNRASEHG